MVTVREDNTRQLSIVNEKEMAKIAEDFKNLESKNNLLYKKLMEQLRERKNVIASVKLSSNRIYIFLVSEDISDNTGYPMEVFDFNGKMIASIIIKEIPVIMAHDQAYYFSEGMDGNPIISRYQIPELTKK